MTTLARIHTGQRAAHEAVTIGAADDMYAVSGTDWPTSGDETVIAHGYIGMRRAHSVDVWSLPGVTPKRVTQGIAPGHTITTWQGTGVVTRVGTIAGFYIVNGKELRWVASEIIEHIWA